MVVMIGMRRNGGNGGNGGNDRNVQEWWQHRRQSIILSHNDSKHMAYIV
jgi:hypothetical protein